MKNLTVRTKITLWFSVLIILLTAVIFTVMLVISNSVLNDDVKDTLVSTIGANTQEIEFFDDPASQEYEAGDQYVKYKDGCLEIDDDYLNETNGVYSALYDSNGSLLYGENIINAPILPDGEMQKLSYNNEKYFVYCEALTDEELDGLMLMGIVNENANKTILTRTVNMLLVALPVLAVFAIAGGYFLAGRFLSPIRKITASAESITGGSDLSKRIELGKSRDELYYLAESFNKMFSRLERSFEEEKQFTSDISHELRTPVAVILAQSEIALEKERSAAEYKKGLGVIKRQSLRLKNIVEQMLQYSRLEKMTELSDTQEVNLSELFENIAQEQAQANLRSIKISSDIDGGIKLDGNGALLERLINNLISNAVKYGKEGGNIYLSLKENEKEILLSVEDDGIGINEENLDKIFNRFFQADNARSAEDSEYSIGLGLSFVSSIARLHGGYVRAESNEGEGSKFTLIIPKNK